MDDIIFTTLFHDLAFRVRKNSINKGFTEAEEIIDKMNETNRFTEAEILRMKTMHESERISLMHTELSEAVEGLRHKNPTDNHIPEFSSVEAEYADVIIRIMDEAARNEYRVAAAVLAKIKYNETRPYKHNGKGF